MKIFKSRFKKNLEMTIKFFKKSIKKIKEKEKNFTGTVVKWWNKDYNRDSLYQEEFFDFLKSDIDKNTP